MSCGDRRGQPNNVWGSLAPVGTSSNHWRRLRGLPRRLSNIRDWRESGLDEANELSRSDVGCLGRSQSLARYKHADHADSVLTLGVMETAVHTACRSRSSQTLPCSPAGSSHADAVEQRIRALKPSSAGLRSPSKTAPATGAGSTNTTCATGAAQTRRLDAIGPALRRHCGTQQHRARRERLWLRRLGLDPPMQRQRL